MADNNDTEIEKCLYCPKTFTGLNNYNRDKHIEFCKNKNGTPKGGNRNIMAFLKSSGSSNKKSPSVSLSLDISSPHYSIQNLFSPLSPAGTDCDSLDSWNQIQDLGCVPLESFKRKIIDLSSTDRSENTESSPSTLKESSKKKNKVDEIKCCGFRGLLDLDSFYENFAFQQLDSLKNVILVNKSFHHKTCNGVAHAILS